MGDKIEILYLPPARLQDSAVRLDQSNLPQSFRHANTRSIIPSLTSS